MTMLCPVFAVLSEFQSYVHGEVHRILVGGNIVQVYAIFQAEQGVLERKVAACLPCGLYSACIPEVK